MNESPSCALPAVCVWRSGSCDGPCGGSRRWVTLWFPSMGSVGSGVAGEQEFAMKSVGTRTTLPRGPPLSRLHAPPSASSDSTATDRGQLNIASSRPGNGDKATHRTGGVSLDACGNGAEKSHELKGRDRNNSKRDSRTPPKILTVSGKLEQVRLMQLC